jgi:MFS transporter, PPP family, 3-phenylpropionic acid transporter
MEEEEDEEEKKEEEGEEEVDWGEVRLLKIMYFLSGLTGSTWGRFAAIYFNKEKHLNSAQIGTIEFAMPMVKTVFQPIHGYIADIYSAKKEVYMCTGVVSTSLLMLLAFPEIARGYKEILVINVAISAFVAGGVLDAYTISVLKSESNVQKYYGRIRLWCAVSWGLGNIVMVRFFFFSIY